MKSFCAATLLAANLALMINSIGCSKAPTDAPKAPAATDSAKKDVFAGLSPEDRIKAIAQRICPVTGEELGGMGTPFKVTIEGRDVFLCCEGCVDALKAEPAKFFAKLDAASKPEGDAQADGGAKAAE